ncbi:hypothetical protein Bca52824_018066 [Brassica carinata]|uniref:Uncharacterized protein n=1 Tax=Brassica carinata TaxID=52824 RepID=A0A8X7VPD3_BRACI|nr:hypothetical protein Bca52824_018066 [Brassica carinata]
MKNIKFKEFIQQFRHHGSLLSAVYYDEVHHAIFKASKLCTLLLTMFLLHGNDELLITRYAKGRAYLALTKIDFTRTGSISERFTHEMEQFLRKQGMHPHVSQPKIRLRPQLAILIKTLLKKNVYQEQAGKLESGDSSDKACNGTLILDSSEESKMGLDVRMCNGNGLQGVPVGLTEGLWALVVMDCENFGPNRFHYPFATDSSNDEDDDNVCLTPRVKHYVEEVSFGETKPSSSSFKAARKARCKAEKG